MPKKKICFVCKQPKFPLRRWPNMTLCRECASAKGKNWGNGQHIPTYKERLREVNAEAAAQANTRDSASPGDTEGAAERMAERERKNKKTF